MRRPEVISMILVVTATSALYGCSSSAKTPAAATATTAPTSPPDSGSSSPSTAAAGSGSTSDLSSMSQEVQAAKNATFKATWTTTDSNGNTSTVTLEQSPPKSRFSTGGSDAGEVVSTGSSTYICSGSPGAQQCFSEAGTNPLQGLLEVYTGGTFLTEVQAFEAEAAAKVAGVDISISHETIAGQSSKCVSVTGGGNSGKYCVTDSGILASVSGSGNNFTLTSYSTSVDPSDFNLPAGASTITIPSGQ